MQKMMFLKGKKAIPHNPCHLDYAFHVWHA